MEAGTSSSAWSSRATAREFTTMPSTIRSVSRSNRLVPPGVSARCARWLESTTGVWKKRATGTAKRSSGTSNACTSRIRCRLRYNPIRHAPASAERETSERTPSSRIGTPASRRSLARNPPSVKQPTWGSNRSRSSVSAISASWRSEPPNPNSRAINRTGLLGLELIRVWTRSQGPQCHNGTILAMSEQVLSRVQQIASDVLLVDVTADSSPETVESWDSVQHLNLILAVEEEYGFQFSPEEMD